MRTVVSYASGEPGATPEDPWEEPARASAWPPREPERWARVRTTVRLPPGHAFVRRQHERFARHPDPFAIARYLEERTTRPADVVRVAARRPTTPEIVRALTRHHGWMGHLEVRAAIARNPFTPTRVARLLVPTCGPRLRAIARANVDPSVRELAARLARA